MRTTGMAKIKSRLVFPVTLSVHEDSYTCVAESGSAIADSKSRLYVINGGAQERNFTQLVNEGYIGAKQPARIVLHSTLYMDVIGNYLF